MSYLDDTAYQGHCRQVLLKGCLLDFSNFLLEIHYLGHKIEVVSRDHGFAGYLSQWSCPLGVEVAGRRFSQLVV